MEKCSDKSCVKNLNVFSSNNKVLNIQLFDVLGKHVKSNKTENTSLDISSLPSGIYMLKIDFQTGLVVKRIIKE